MRKITLFAGHYGSGKTNVAINWARHLKRTTRGPVVIGDLDIVNPYFRTKDSMDDLAADGISLVVSDFANSNVDFPALPREIYSLVQPDTPGYVVFDVGGDDRGALALGRYVDDIRATGDYDMLAVVNAARPLTRTPSDALEVLREIESASRLPFTGVVNNTNLGPDTCADDILASRDYAEAVASALGVPLVMTAVSSALVPALAGRVADVFPLDLQRLYYQLDGR